MAITKFMIYNYWKEKAVTNRFQVKNWNDCEDHEEAIPIVEFCDDICCWACQLPSLTLDDPDISINDDLKKEWNHDKSLQKAHILAKSLGGQDSVDNRFLLCPTCHAESPDTIEKSDFFAWVYYKRQHENYMTTLLRELERACKIKNVEIQDVQEYFSNYDLDQVMNLRKRMIKSCTMHGSYVAWSSKMMTLINEVEKDK